ncbi:MAG: hypothetical protein ACK5EE_06675 [Ignavibacteria bacterium]|jgi:Na+-driven multidrug efflux pump
MSQIEPLSQRAIFRFWYPLSATWLMMAAEGPLLTSLIARLDDPKHNLAAYGVATAIAMIIESPIIMMLSASIALVKDAPSYHALRGFIIKLNIMVTVGMLLTLIPPIFNFIAFSLLNLSPEVGELMYGCLAAMVLWPAAIGFRRFWQGLLIRAHQTRKVAIGTIVRLLTMFLSAMFMVNFTTLHGTYIGGIALTVGVICESIATRIMAHETIVAIRNEPEHFTEAPLTNKYMISYYTPLALTSLIGMASMPIITFFIGRSPMSLESLAVLPIIESFVFIFRSVGFAYQEVGLALLGPRNEQNKPLRTFGVTVGLTTSGIYSLLVFTPLIHPVLSGLYGLSDELASFAVLPSRIVVILPFLAISFAYFRSIMMNNRRNAIVTYSTMIEVGGMIALIFLTVTLFKPVGIIAAAIGLSFGRLGAQWFLLWMYRRVMPARSEQ